METLAVKVNRTTDGRNVVRMSKMEEGGWLESADLYWEEFVGLCRLLRDGGPPEEDECYIVPQMPNLDRLPTYHVYVGYLGRPGSMSLYVCDVDMAREGHATMCQACCGCHHDHLTHCLDLSPEDVRLLSELAVPGGGVDRKRLERLALGVQQNGQEVSAATTTKET